MRVLAALSGGVDSAVAAARAAEAGHDVTAVHMALMKDRAQTREGARGCCSIEDASDARRSADKLGLDFYVWDLSDEFEDLVVRDFLDTYAAGQTPNPCVRCNQFIKFQVLARRADALGFDAVATGHYARVSPAGGGPEVVLRRAVDRAKDQSYVLAVAGPEALARCLFPLGTVESKGEVRAEAARRGLPVSAKPDSFDICFVADGDTRGFLRSRLGERPGPILDQTGAQVGSHRGAYGFTIGQRRGLGLGRPAIDGEPRYVTAIDTAANTVRVGPAASLSVDRFGVRDPIWLDPAAAGLVVGGGLACQVQVRAHGRALDATVSLAVDSRLPDVAPLVGKATAAAPRLAEAAAAAEASAAAAAAAATATGAVTVEQAAAAEHGLASDANPCSRHEMRDWGARDVRGAGGTGVRLEVRLSEPLRALAPGQSAVFYDGDRVLGHALIAA
ncbi:MAG: tRNA 2-thiouridine(34) synthase MnmA [Bifidobacteriaceae bacterium]|jgi:tRNA-specific 2-thiouridylase|nr:tRNA 2-thiouridine(34) synthase MnmA [Bifidobacteriaceae bacterium]